MRYSSFNWKSGTWAKKPRRGWIFGPFWGRTLTVMWEWKPPSTTTVPVVEYRGDVYGMTDRGVYHLGAMRQQHNEDREQ